MRGATTLLATLLVVSYIVSITSTSITCTEKDFSEFKVSYKRNYQTQDEHQKRFSIFCQNLQQAQKLNELHPRASFGVTKFSDLAPEEFRARFLGTKVPETLLQPTRSHEETFAALNQKTLLSAFDWRNNSKNILTPIYNQEQCGSCWSFSATENIESVWALAGNDLVSLSMQQIVDCDKSDSGCNGGYPSNAMGYIGENGQELFSDYPYKGVSGKCQYDSSKVVAHITGWENTGTKNETAMSLYLSSVAPLSVCVDAAHWSSYQSGILSAKGCGRKIDHAVLAVAYNLDEQYWTIRNSWGEDWGEQGFIRIEYGKNACAVSEIPVSAYISSEQ